ncbi:hypothetical protein CHCC14809_3353 [Bacillus licheniformis]|jgi:hypothetical protein|uniref:Uncharacterized protein n=1 Tax=Bacillus licheniformis TaxID=1402 RepID=A0A8B5YDH1_BACLI|nr:hypothetical protein [Bacillus licheniformis]EQM29177.1 hypothetical protein N399_06495 [Bacillus licheniformis CG-B52]KYC70859.1 hypothetical protein B4092_1259 [Bacillus licheniformis]KYC81574.1 hypothetical protein B4090_1341 [Bacillus licheniformis]KYC85195.1 hypothetical protein B4091_1256 [Bacillus licheniformis]KYC93722.1 hypothetical protein B4164_1022 [Bacillus licheniformis]
MMKNELLSNALFDISEIGVESPVLFTKMSFPAGYVYGMISFRIE